MKDKGKSEKTDDIKVLCHENIYRRNCQTGPLKTDRSELCLQCPIREILNKEIGKHSRFYNEQKNLLPADQFEQFMNPERTKLTEGMRQAVKDADDPGKGRTTNWEGVNTLYIVNKEILQLIKGFGDGKGQIEKEAANNRILSERDKKFIRLVQAGQTAKEIGPQFNIGEDAVKKWKRRLCQRLKVNSLENYII